MRSISRPKRSPKNHPVMAFDVETQGRDRKFVCGCFQDADGQRFTTDREQLIEWLTSPDNAGGIIYATNLFYDFTSVFGGFPHPCKALFAGARLIRVHWPVPGKRVIRFYDTSNLTNRLSVASLGKMVGLAKLDTPEVLTNPDSGALTQGHSYPVRMAQIEEYNRRDTEITFRFASRFQRVCRELGCEVKTTIASTGMDLFKRRYMQKGLVCPSPWLNDYLREAYHGGLVFVFRKGLGKEVTYYDIHSLYPYVLANRPYPDVSSLRWVKSNPRLSLVEEYEGFSRVRVRYPPVYFPILPVVINGYLTTVTGEYEGLWTHVELREAVKRGCEILDIPETIYFTRTITPLKGYMETLYSTRQHSRNTSDSFEAVYKLLMNALSGKWGQRSDNSLFEPVDVSGISDPKDLEGIVTLCAGDLEYYVKPKVSYYQPDFINVAWAAYMTAYARLHEIEYLEEAFPDVFACDTDSVFTSHSFAEGGSLGDMGVKEGVRDWLFLFPKQYASYNSAGAWVGKIKGVPKRGQSDYFRSGSYTWDKPCTFKESIREGVTPGDWVSRTRTDRPKYDKRVFLEDVNPWAESTDSRPFTYEEALAYFGDKPPASDWRTEGVIPRTTIERWSDREHERKRIRAELDSLSEACVVPSRVVFSLWNYRDHKYRQVRNYLGELVPWEYGPVDEMATELGFESSDALMQAVESQVRLYARIRELRRRL